MMNSRFVMLLCLILPIAVDAQAPASQRVATEPALPVIDYKACPFEGCTFGNWILTQDVTLLSTWKEGAKAVTIVPKGQVVKGLTGVHITYEPDRVQVLQAIPKLQLQPGDVVLRYMYRGEGYADIWAKGQWKREYDSTFITEKDDSGCLRDCAAKVVSEGRKDWWVQVKTSSGATGWVKAENQFDCMDHFGGSDECYDADVSEARAEVEANLRTPEGKAYDQQLGDEFGKKYANTLRRCLEDPSNKADEFSMVVKLKKDGKVEEVLLQPMTKLGQCVRETLYADSFSPPPRAAYWVGIHIKMQ